MCLNYSRRELQLSSLVKYRDCNGRKHKIITSFNRAFGTVNSELSPFPLSLYAH